MVLTAVACAVVVSAVHCSQDFLNNVCTNIIHMHKKQLNYYSGNYDQYVQTRAELEENQMKRYKWEQEQISHMKVTLTPWLCVTQAGLPDVAATYCQHLHMFPASCAAGPAVQPAADFGARSRKCPVATC
jgi:hypothetical protein